MLSEKNTLMLFDLYGIFHVQHFAKLPEQYTNVGNERTFWGLE